MAELAAHPVTAMFPMMTAAELDGLTEDIRANTLEEPIVVQGSVVLDGRNRLEACKRLGIEPARREWGEGDPTTWIISTNLHRRQMSTSQRAALGAELKEHFAKLAKERQREHAGTAPGRAKTLQPDPAEVSVAPQARDLAAEVVSVGRTAVTQAATVKSKDARLFEAVKSGDLTVDRAYKQIRRREAEELGEKIDALAEHPDDEIAAAAAKVARSRLNYAYSRGCKAAHELTRLKPAALLDSLTSSHWASHDRLAADVRRWLDEMDRVREQPIRLLEGNRG